VEDSCDLLCLDLPRAEALRNARLEPAEAERRAAAAQALGDATRLTVAVSLRGGEELCVCDLSWIAERSEKVVSHHARALRNAGLAASRREGRMVMYRLTEEGQRLLDALLAAEVAQ
jgi:ArsR family transcriptional regulator, lead/cadmium/zinc/bismuth-responsive transcriptional repressor